MFSRVLAMALVVASAVALPVSESDNTVQRGCGEVNVFLTGLPPFHPLVTEQGFNGTEVDAALRADHAKIIAAGYNCRFSLFGPENPIEVLNEQLSDVDFAGVGVGAGVRASVVTELVAWLENLIQGYRDTAQGPIFFNQNATSTLAAIQRHFPLMGDCTDQPGKDLEFRVICDESTCKEP